MKLSIIIPVYNTSKYLRKCLDSCVNQDIPSSDYEVIVVNDGSKDDSLLIINEYIRANNNFILIDQSNQGLSMARNNALKIAKGDYVWFVDSDDWIQENCLSELIRRLTKNNLDAIIIKGIRVINDTEKPFEEDCDDNTIETGLSRMSRRTINCSAVKTIVKRKVIIDNKLLFYPGIYHEDQEFAPRLYYHLQRVQESDLHLYYNRLVVGSITQSINPKKGFDLLTVALSLDSFNKKVVPKKYQSTYSKYISLDINQSLSNIYKADSLTKKLYLQQLKKNRYVLKNYLKTDNIIYKITGAILYIFPQLSLHYYHISQIIKRK